MYAYDSTVLVTVCPPLILFLPMMIIVSLALVTDTCLWMTPHPNPLLLHYPTHPQSLLLLALRLQKGNGSDVLPLCRVLPHVSLLFLSPPHLFSPPQALQLTSEGVEEGQARGRITSIRTI